MVRNYHYAVPRGRDVLAHDSNNTRTCPIPSVPVMRRTAHLLNEFVTSDEAFDEPLLFFFLSHRYIELRLPPRTLNALGEA